MGVEIRYDRKRCSATSAESKALAVSDPNEEYEARSGSRFILCAEQAIRLTQQMRAAPRCANADLSCARSRHDTGEEMTLGLGAKAAWLLAGRPRHAH